mmetsp:Transcript_46497/g.100210  ORF Transcript_46497/g.100210 Transcript_46497/m.100210 type:complete len:98 (-) Transcript_46497:742-1035(-)
MLRGLFVGLAEKSVKGKVLARQEVRQKAGGHWSVLPLHGKKSVKGESHSQGVTGRSWSCPCAFLKTMKTRLVGGAWVCLGSSFKSASAKSFRSSPTE